LDLPQDIIEEGTIFEDTLSEFGKWLKSWQQQYLL
jgi:hypothetical protein